MTELYGILYGCYFILLGGALRVTLSQLFSGTAIADKNINSITHAFFIGIVCHVIVFNGLQFFSLSHQQLRWLTVSLFCLCLLRLTWHHWKTPQVGLKQQFNKAQPLPIFLVVCGSLFIYWNSSLLPNIAWDSWAVWEGRAEQWLYHGLSSHIETWPEWINSENTLFNYSAHYPDGLSLVYFLPKLFTADNLIVTEVLILLAYALAVLSMAQKIAQSGAPVYLQLMLIIVMYSTPLINNHLMLQGYADIWVGMYILLIIMTLFENHYKPNLLSKLTLLMYLALLPMLKLEGWVWMILLAAAYFIVVHTKTKARLYMLALFTLTAIVLWLNGGIHLSFSFGEIIINKHNLVVFNLINSPFEFVNITPALLSGFFLQNNWSILWFGLPLLLLHGIRSADCKATQVTQLFFILSILCFLFLFYFTEASRWAIDMTAMNRIVLQLTPCYIILLFRAMTEFINHPQPN